MPHPGPIICPTTIPYKIAPTTKLSFSNFWFFELLFSNYRSYRFQIESLKLSLSKNGFNILIACKLKREQRIAIEKRTKIYSKQKKLFISVCNKETHAYVSYYYFIFLQKKTWKLFFIINTHLCYCESKFSSN